MPLESSMLFIVSFGIGSFRGEAESVEHETEKAADQKKTSVIAPIPQEIPRAIGFCLAGAVIILSATLPTKVPVTPFAQPIWTSLLTPGQS
jgi:hypothetical protein